SRGPAGAYQVLEAASTSADPSPVAFQGETGRALGPAWADYPDRQLAARGLAPPPPEQPRALRLLCRMRRKIVKRREGSARPPIGPVGAPAATSARPNAE